MGDSENGMRSACALLAVAATTPHPALAWGDKAHEIIALIAAHHLDLAASAEVAMMLAADTETFTAHDIAIEVTRGNGPVIV